MAVALLLSLLLLFTLACVQVAFDQPDGSREDAERPPAVYEAFADLDRAIVVRHSVVADAAADDAVRRPVARLRYTIGTMIAQQRQRADARRAAVSARRAHTRDIALIGLGALAVALFGLLFLVWQRRVRRHRRLSAAIEAAEWHAAIIDSAADAILILDAEGSVEALNAAATRMLGYQPADLIARDIAAIVDLPPGDGSFRARIGLAEGRLREPFLADRTIRRRDGRPIAIDVALGVLDIPDGVRIVMSLHDISERKRMARRKDDLRATISHEMRTPLTSIVGSLGLLRAGVVAAMPPEAERLVGIAESNSRRLIRLINDMLDIDRIDSGKLEMVLAPIDLRDVIDQACIGSEALARAAGVVLRCVRGDHPATVQGDAERLLQVTANLLSNAIRLAPPGSVVELGLAIDGGQATAYVDDRGRGVPHAFRDRIFGRFERADRHDGAGAGLGLAISREIVTRHGGTLWFEDRAGGGTRFAFALTLSDAVATPAALPDDGAAMMDDFPRRRSGAV